MSESKHRIEILDWANPEIGIDNNGQPNKICPVCKEAFPLDAVFCGNCGTRLTQDLDIGDNNTELDKSEYTIKPSVNTCPSCGSEQPEDAVFCGVCGIKLKRVDMDNSVNGKTNYCEKLTMNLKVDADNSVNGTSSSDSLFDESEELEFLDYEPEYSGNIENEETDSIIQVEFVEENSETIDAEEAEDIAQPEFVEKENEISQIEEPGKNDELFQPEESIQRYEPSQPEESLQFSEPVQYEEPIQSHGELRQEDFGQYQELLDTIVKPPKAQPKRNIKIIIAIIVLLLSAVSAFFIISNLSDKDDSKETTVETNEETAEGEVEAEVEAEETNYPPVVANPKNSAQKSGAGKNMIFVDNTTGHAYALFNYIDLGLNSFDEWEAFCEKKGGHLAIIDSEAENTFVFGSLRSTRNPDNGNKMSTAFFGFTDRDEEGTWEWLYDNDGYEPNWADGQPNNSVRGEDYALFDTDEKNGKWMDSKIGVTSHWFICEWEPKRE